MSNIARKLKSFVRDMLIFNFMSNMLLVALVLQKSSAEDELTNGLKTGNVVAFDVGSASTLPPLSSTNGQLMDFSKALFNALDFYRTGAPSLLDVMNAANAAGASDEQLRVLETLFTEADTDSSHKLNEDKLRSVMLDIEKDIDFIKPMMESLKDTTDPMQLLLGVLAKLQRPLELEGNLPRCQPGYFRSGDYCYMELPTCHTYSDAVAACTEANADVPKLYNVTDWLTLQDSLRWKGYGFGDYGRAIWIDLRKQGNSGDWLWSDTFPLEVPFWAPGQPDGPGSLPSCANATAGKHCAVGLLARNEGEKRPSGWAAAACEAKTADILTVCQQRAEMPDIELGNLNADFKIDDFTSMEFELSDDSIVLAGKDKDNLKNVSSMLGSLNQNYLFRYNPNASMSDVPSVQTPLLHDLFPRVGCLEKNVLSTQCTPQQGKKRRRKRGCSDRRKRTAYLEPLIGWKTSPKIRYVFEKKAVQHERTKNAALDSMKYWSDRTCVDFVEDTRDFEVIVARKKGCWSSVGRDIEQVPKKYVKGSGTEAVPFPQVLSLGTGCDKFFIAAHEFGHLIGLEHEQAREDRNQFVEIVSANIQQKQLMNFDRCTACCVPANYTYDFGSIMHYSPKEFAINKKSDTIRDKFGGLYMKTMGNVFYPSFYDVLQINQILCWDKCPKEKNDCVNGGYPHPRDCSKCICPTGFGGKLCERNGDGRLQLRRSGKKHAKRDTEKASESCGAVLDADAKEATLSTPSFPAAYVLNGECYWFIKAPEGKVVQLSVHNASFSLPVDCRFGHIEVKFQADLAVTGIQYCGRQGPSVIKSESRIMIVIFRIIVTQEHPVRGFKAQYSAVDAEQKPPEKVFFDIDSPTVKAAPREPWPISQTIYDRSKRWAPPGSTPYATLEEHETSPASVLQYSMPPLATPAPQYGIPQAFTVAAVSTPEAMPPSVSQGHVSTPQAMPLSMTPPPSTYSLPSTVEPYAISTLAGPPSTSYTQLPTLQPYRALKDDDAMMLEDTSTTPALASEDTTSITPPPVTVQLNSSSLLIDSIAGDTKPHNNFVIMSTVDPILIDDVVISTTLNGGLVLDDREQNTSSVFDADYLSSLLLQDSDSSSLVVKWLHFFAAHHNGSLPPSAGQRWGSLIKSPNSILKSKVQKPKTEDDLVE